MGVNFTFFSFLAAFKISHDFATRKERKKHLYFISYFFKHESWLKINIKIKPILMSNSDVYGEL